MVKKVKITKKVIKGRKRHEVTHTVVVESGGGASPLLSAFLAALSAIAVWVIKRYSS